MQTAEDKCAAAENAGGNTESLKSIIPSVDGRYFPTHADQFKFYWKQLCGWCGFKIKFQNPLMFDSDASIESITLKLNQELEKMILNNPEQWIWTHDRWK